MHDQVRVRVGDGFEHVDEQAQASVGVERVLVAVVIDALAFDVLEHQVGMTARRHAGVDEVRDVRMGEAREDVAFAAEPLFAGPAHQREVEQLDRDPSLEAAVAALAQPHAAHAALTDALDEAVRADGLSAERREAGVLRQGHGLLQEFRGVELLVLGEQRAQIGGERGVVFVDRREPFRALRGRQIERFVQIRAQLAPAVGAEGRHLALR